MKSYTSIVNQLFDNNLPDVILPDEKNTEQASSLPSLSLSSSQVSSSSLTSSSVPKSSNNTYNDLQQIAFPNQIHRSFYDIATNLGIHNIVYPFSACLTFDR